MVPEASVDKNLPVYAMRGLGWQKPDLVGVGSAVAANSDGDSNSARDSEEYGVQCGLKANVSTGLFGCDVLEALPYDSKAAVVQKTGSSVAAAFVAGAAVIIRQYFFDGFYPYGVRESGPVLASNQWAKPAAVPAALIKAMLITSASPMTGRTNINTYFPDPACDQELQTAPCPLVFSTSRPPLTATPNMIEGHGRPELQNVLWFADSPWSLWIRNNVATKAGFMHTYSLRLLKSDTVQFKLTLCYTDPPSTAGASHVLVNDLDLVVQREGMSMVLNTSIGKQMPTRSFQTDFGNARGGPMKDGANTCEVFVLPTHEESIVTVVVVAFRLVSAQQAYSVVAKGLLRPKYYTWIYALDGAIAAYLLDISTNGLEAGWTQLDLFQRGMLNGLLLQDFEIVFPDASEDVLLELLTEADDNRDRKLDYAEFVALVTELRTGALRAAEPAYTEEPAPPDLLSSTNDDKNTETTSPACRRQTPGAAGRGWSTAGTLALVSALAHLWSTKH